jgi:hypothetical protein
MRLSSSILHFAIFLILISHSSSLFGQRIPDPNTGQQDLQRQGIMDGNLVRTIFLNWGEIAHWPENPSGEWPKGTGHSYVDGVALVVQARTVDNNGQVIYPMETQYREFVDRGPSDELWGWAPLPGYFNQAQRSPAISNDPLSWPDFWPDKPPDGWVNPNEIRNDYDDDGNGLIDDLVYWNGFFGKGVFNADLETYFVFDDDPDEEWDFFPDPSDTTRRGLGLEVAARLFQWTQVMAEDVIFAVYFITNEGQTDYDSTYYSFYIDWGVGGTDDSSDDTGDFDTGLDIAWAWDFDGKGTPGNWQPVGVAGFAFLESPGIDDDMRDNDEDGLIDETRVSSGPGVWLDAFPYGVDNVDDFIAHFKREPGPHWSNDEDGDWVAYTDGNNNGQWDPGEALNADVGLDGLGPTDFGYPGPDLGEANGQPDPGEPDFDFVDKDEADQIGLTGFRIFPVHTYELWNEKQNWEVFRSAPQPASQQVTANLGMFFSSGPFPLSAGDTENYSMALLFGDNRNDLVLTKNTIQQIYNADYRFSKPPLKPELTSVIPGDGKVTLVWDDRAESSWDPFLQEFDFEGYKIYRSTEPQFLDIKDITDAYARQTYSTPIAHFDLVNDYQGLHPVDWKGANYDLGQNSGLKHFFVDEDVINGQTYYYAVVSYDRGLVAIDTLTGEITGIPPSECPKNIDVDVAGNVRVDINTAEVTPTVPAAGYLNPRLEDGLIRETIGTGNVSIEVLYADSVRDGHTYSVEFSDTSALHYQGTPFYKIYDITNDQRVLKVDTTWIDEFSQSPLTDGFTLAIENDEADFDFEKSGWITGNTTYKWRVNLDDVFSNLDLNINYPADYDIIFSDVVIDTADNTFGFPPYWPTKFTVFNVTENISANFQFIEHYVIDSTLSPYYPWHDIKRIENALIWVDNPGSRFGKSTTWRFYFEADDSTGQVAPEAGDVFRIATKKPFRNDDRITFTIRGEDYSQEKAKTDLNDIAVVPNPYLAAAEWEQRDPFRTGRGERRITFIHLPAKCTIRIYTVRGYLVETIEHNSSIQDGSETWNLLTKDNQELAYGVYIFHVDAPGVGEKVGKFAIIK